MLRRTTNPVDPMSSRRYVRYLEQVGRQQPLVVHGPGVPVGALRGGAADAAAAARAAHRRRLRAPQQ